MTRLRVFLSRLLGLIHARRLDRDLRQEIAGHLAEAADEYVRQGLSPDDARLAALRAFGGVTQAEDAHRDARALGWLDAARRDLPYGTRMLRRTPGFTAAALLTLALGIGVNTAMFSFSDATAFRPPDVPKPGDLLRVFSSRKEAPYGRLSYPDYLDYRERLTSVSGIVAYDSVLVALSEHQEDIPQLLGGWVVSGNFFSVLQVEPSLGRGFRDDEDRAGANAVALISHRLWERRFRSDPAVVGTPILLGTRAFTIIGVTPARFGGTELYFHPDVYVPLAFTREIESTLPDNLLQDRSDRWLNVLGRLKPGLSVHTADAEVVAIARSLEQAYAATNRGQTATAMPEMRARAVLDDGGYQGAVLSLAIVGLILIIACANVANLMLSRAAGRAREVAVRLALGASRGRLVQQLLTESLLLAGGGGILGIAVAFGAIRYVSIAFAANFAVSDLPIHMDARIDQRALLFSLGATMATGLLFGLAPAVRSTRIDLVAALKASSTTEWRQRWLTLRNALVGSQVALSVAVLTVAGLSIRGYVEKLRADPGFRTDHVLLMSFNPGLVHYSQDQTRQFYQDIVERAKTLPGVVATGLAQYIPLGTLGGSTSVVVDGYEMPEGQTRLSIPSNVVDAGYWGTMRTSIVGGRAFDDRDAGSSPGVVIVNETMARRFWPGQDALGKTIHLRDRTGPAVQVVGIAKDGKYAYLAEAQQPYLFMPFSQRFRANMTMVVLARDDAASVAAPIRAEVEALGARVPVFDVRTLEDLYQSRALMSSRLVTQIMSSLGVLALVLAVVGVCGVISYITTLRTREIGIRVAMGADRRRVSLLVLKQSVPMVVPGLVVGAALAFFLTPAFAVPFDFVPRDGRVLALASFVIGIAAVGASFIPACRAAMLAPTTALRDE
ncbi:MAG TPA: ABC transporter permease [Vicinamibacterales bacterium]|nr:ABC transporter permease [Vicinamibacterales bacterium]